MFDTSGPMFPELECEGSMRGGGVFPKVKDFQLQPKLLSREKKTQERSKYSLE